MPKVRHDVAHLYCIFAVVIKQKYNMKRMSLKARQRSRRNLERAIFKKELFHTPRRIRPKDAWSIKVDTAKFLVPRLKMFLKEIDKVGATPGILARQYPDDGYERWREMVKRCCSVLNTMPIMMNVNWLPAIMSYAGWKRVFPFFLNGTVTSGYRDPTSVFG